MLSVAGSVLRYAAITALWTSSVTTYAQLTPPQTSAPAKSTAPTNSVDQRKYVNDLARLSRQGDPAATAELSQYIFSVVAIPVKASNGLHLTQRIAQAETDYRNGAQPAVHEADLVRAHNNLVHSLQLPDWVATNADEVRLVHTDFALAYPELLADKASLDKNGRLSLLSDDLSPAQVMFLETSLLYQKLHNPKFRMTGAERAAGGPKALPLSVQTERKNYMGPISNGKFDNVSLFDLNHAVDSLFSDLRMSNALRSEFDKPDLLPASSIEKESK